MSSPSTAEAWRILVRRANEYCEEDKRFFSESGISEYWIEHANMEEIAIGRMKGDKSGPGKPSTLWPIPFELGWEKLLNSESGGVPAGTIPKGVKIQEIAVVTLLEGIIEWSGNRGIIRFCD